MRIAFRNQPLPFHQHAREAAEAAMAANAQGKFWQMNDKLFANQQALDRPSLDKYAQELGLNMAKFKSDMDGHKQKEQIDADSAAGNAVGANGTPAFFINGRSLSGAQPFEAFKAVIDEELKHADKLIAEGTPADKVYEKIISSIPSQPQGAAGPGGGAPAAPAARVEVAIGDAPVKGPKSAPVTVLEFSDFQ